MDIRFGTQEGYYVYTKMRSSVPLRSFSEDASGRRSSVVLHASSPPIASNSIGRFGNIPGNAVLYRPLENKRKERWNGICNTPHPYPTHIVRYNGKNIQHSTCEVLVDFDLRGPFLVEPVVRIEYYTEYILKTEKVYKIFKFLTDFK